MNVNARDQGTACVLSIYSKTIDVIASSKLSSENIKTSKLNYIVCFKVCEQFHILVFVTPIRKQVAVVTIETVL